MKLFPKLVLIGAIAAALVGSCLTMRARALPNEAHMSFVNTDQITVGVLDNVEVELRFDYDIPAIISTLEYFQVIILYPEAMLEFDKITLPSSMPGGFIVENINTATFNELRFTVHNGFLPEPIWSGPFAQVKWKANNEGDGVIAFELTYGLAAGRSTVEPPGVGGYAMNGSGTWFGLLNTNGLSVPVDVVAGGGGGGRGELMKPGKASTWGSVKQLYKR